MAKVLSDFIEDGRLYKTGASFPAEGVEVTQERLDYLSDSSKNGAVAFIEVEKKKDERYDEYNVDDLKKLLTDKKVEFAANAKKPQLFALAVEKELI